MVRNFSLPPEFENVLKSLLKDRGLELSDSRKIAEAVLRMSDFYIANPQAPTPWKQNWCQLAQISYYLPLNLLRARAVFQEAQELQFPVSKNEIVDFGSGLGAGSWPWLSSDPSRMQFIESSSEAQKIHRRILELLKHSTDSVHWLAEKDLRPAKNRTAIFSYSLTELAKIPSWVQDCESLIIIEPSTREEGRKLLEHRKQWLAEGFSMWAPCPHQQACPLLEDSKRDWCHDRIGFEMPDWFLEIERHLPMKNSTLTFGYLLASKTPAPASDFVRTIGDQLKEKGRTRQMICVDSKRQFTTWLHRHGPVPEVPRGTRVRRT